MIFNRFVISLLVAGSLSLFPCVVVAQRPFRGGDSSSNNNDDVIRNLLDKVDQLQEQLALQNEQISDLKEEVAEDGNNVQIRSTSAGRTYNKRNARARARARGLVSESVDNKQGRRLSKGNSKNGVDTICYGEKGLISVQDVDEMITGAYDRTKLELGVVEVDEDEGMTIEVTASSLILNVIGGEVCDDQICLRKYQRKLTGSVEGAQRYYVQGSGIVMYPLVYTCDESLLSSCDSDDSVCQRNACVRDLPGSLIPVEPNVVLPLTITIIGGMEATEVHKFSTGYIGYEIDGALDIETNTLKFFAKPEDVADSSVFVELAIVVATGGIHWDEGPDAPWWAWAATDHKDLQDWTWGAAVLGPHLIEISTSRVASFECEEVEED